MRHCVIPVVCLPRIFVHVHSAARTFEPFDSAHTARTSYIAVISYLGHTGCWTFSLKVETHHLGTSSRACIFPLQTHNAQLQRRFCEYYSFTYHHDPYQIFRLFTHSPLPTGPFFGPRHNLQRPVYILTHLPESDPRLLRARSHMPPRTDVTSARECALEGKNFLLAC